MPVLFKESFAIQLRRMSVLTLDVSEILFRILSDPSVNPEGLASQVAVLAKENRKDARSLLNKLNRAPVKPVDERSMRRMSDALEDLMNSLEQVSFRLVVFNLRESIPFTAMIAETISQQARRINSLLSDSCGDGQSAENCEETIRLQEEVERIHESCMLHLFDSVKDPVEVIRRKQIIDDLHRASIAAREIGCIIKPLLEDRSCRKTVPAR